MKTFKQAEGEEDMMTVLANIDNRMPLDESHLDPHIEEYIGGWVEKKVFEKKTIYLFMHSSSFQCDYLMVAPIPYQADSQLSRVTEDSVGVQIRQGVTLHQLMLLLIRSTGLPNWQP